MTNRASDHQLSESSSGGGLFARVRDPNIWRVYATTFALGMAYGIAISVIAIFLDDRGYNKSSIGQLAAWFAGGIVAFSLPMGFLIRRFSAKVTLTVSLIGYAFAVTAFPFLDSFAAIAAVRFFDGACSVGVWVSSETILLQRADRHNKAFITSLYSISLAVGYIAGPIAARMFTPMFPLSVAFVIAGAIALGAALYTWLRLEDKGIAHDDHATLADDEPAAEVALQERDAPRPVVGRDLIWRIKTSCFATFAYGYFQASVVLFLPLYLMESKGVLKEQTIVIPAFFAAGMLLFSNLSGRLGDRHGHLLVMRVLGVIGLAMILGFVFLTSYPAMCAAVFVAGASLASISPVSLALQGVVAAPHEYSRATAVYNAFYAGGMLLGPPASSYLFDAYGGASMLFHLAALWVGFVLFSVVFYRDDPAALRGARDVQVT
jgi:MFS family permease